MPASPTAPKHRPYAHFSAGSAKARSPARARTRATPAQIRSRGRLETTCKKNGMPASWGWSMKLRYIAGSDTGGASASAAPSTTSPSHQASAGWLAEIESVRFKAIAQQIIHGRQLVRAVEPRHGRQLPHDVVRRDRRRVLDALAVDGHLAQATPRHVTHDLDREFRRRLGALRPRRMPDTHRLEVIRHAAHHDALVEVDARHVDLRTVHVKAELEEVELEARGEHADVAFQFRTALQHDGGRCEALYLAGLHHHLPAAHRVLEAD